MEVMLVLVVLGILVGLYTASTGDLSNVSIDAASRKVQSDLRYAHQLAISTGMNHGAVFNAGGSYEVYVGSSGNPIMDPVTRGDLVEDLADFEGISIAENYTVEFDATGDPIAGGDDHVRLQADSGAVRDVYVVDNTGAVIVDHVQLGSGCSCELCSTFAPGF